MKQITISGVLDLLDQGFSREQIATEYGISMKACKKLFQNPNLKGKKAKKQEPIEFELINDLEEEDTSAQNLEEVGLEELSTEAQAEVAAEDLSAEDKEVEMEEEASQAETPKSPTWNN